ncbi:hypothetical protein [Streptomyces sp. NPDC054794]
MTTEPMNLRSLLHADAHARAGAGTDAHLPGAAAVGAPRTPAYDLDGIEEASPAQGFDPEDAGLSAELPPDTALLCVKGTTYAGEPSFELHFHHRGRVFAANRSTDLAHRRQPGLGLPRLVERAERKGWRSTYRHVKGWWQTETVLAAWVDRLKQGDAPRLIVWDQTPHEIPWELLHRRSAGLHRPPRRNGNGDGNGGGDGGAGAGAGAGGWLGATLPVIRWTTVWDGARAWRYDARPQHCRGGVLVYEDPEFAVAVDSVVKHEVGERSTTMADLRTRLGDPATAFGLLLIRCHGKYSEDIEEFRLGGVPLPELSEDWEMDALQETGAAVLINSCVSARPVVDRRYNAAVPRNFAEVFLRWGASAVIATVAEVSKAHAHDFAARLVRSARHGPVNLADELMKHRAYYARRAERALAAGDEDGAEEALEAFFTSFMYAYFGHPGTTLTLEAPGREGGDGT